MSDVKTIEQAPIEQTPRPIPEVVQKQYDHLVETIRAYNPGADFAQIDAAFHYAAAHHGTQKRKDGSPFVTHPIAVAQIVAEELHLDSESIIAALLHDCIEDTDATYDDIAKRFSPTVADLVEGVSKLTRVHYTSKEEEQMENLRKMLMAMAKDIRVILIKMADRLHNMRTMAYQSEEKQRIKSLETMEIYAPIAHRLGMQKIKWELEDLSLLYLDPEGYRAITDALEARMPTLEKFMDEMRTQIRERLELDGVHATISSRIKHIYSIYRKMYAQKLDINGIFDLCAFRVIVDTIPDCYNVLGIIHDMYKPLPGRFKDYISTPKPNMYQSVHTTVIGSEGIPFEVQIRTWEMHQTAEYGVAAHWKYKQHAGEGSEKEFEWVRRLLENQQDTEADDYIHSLKVDMFDDEVFVFTPKGKVISLPAGSTPIDFAYAIHSAVGNSMIGAKVNNRIANIDTFIDELPLGYNTKIGADGHGLSVGQKQRLLIARAAYKEAKYLFFDEATNSLDANNERTIMERLDRLFENKTVVVVAHRLSTVRNADKIVVLDRGRIVEQGTHDELTAERGYYYELVRNQLELGN